MEKKKIDYLLKRQEEEQLRRKNIGDYFYNFSKLLRPWLYSLAETYKKNGDLPINPLLILPSYYQRKEDKEIAAYVTLLVNDNFQIDKIKALQKLLGESPWQWFVERNFVGLSVGNKQNKRTAGIENWKIARLMDSLWMEYKATEVRQRPLTGKNVSSLQDIVDGISKIQQCSYFDTLTYLLQDCSVGQYFYKLRLLLLVLATSDGFGLNLWNICASDLKCPLTSDVRQFVQNWFPDYRRFGNIDDAISLFGFEKDCDFFYACLGYKELQKRKPNECSVFSTRYNNWYDNCITAKPHKWREIMPDLVLGFE